MFALALRSLRHRIGGFAASFLAMFLGATVLMAFASMLDTAGGEGVDSTSEETLTTMGTVVGFWGLLLVVFAVSSTLTLSVRQRSAEMALLRSVGATPGQVTRLIVGETAVLAVVAAVLAIVPAMLGGRLLLHLLGSTDQVASDVSFAFGPIALAMGMTITFVAATLAALLTARRAARMNAADAVAAAARDNGGLSRKRIAVGVGFLLLAVNLAVVTATVMKGEGSDAMQTAGQTSIWAAIGLAVLAPALVRRVAGLLAGPLERRGPTGYLTAQNLRRHTGRLAAVVMPVVLFTAIGTATLVMQAVENDAMAASGLSKTNQEKNVETLNFVVIGMIVAFAAIMLVNTLVAATANRRREFAQTRLAGATPRQILDVVVLEGVVLTATGVLFGTLASLTTILPYSYARTGDVLPGTGAGVYLGVVAVAAVLTVATGYAATRRAIRTPAISAVA
ncbi:FtsX-like permease family protein [Yinghuangia sp. ASG 101]|uniref:FtsX-like permease family protein n=1 Tax=Yinghuangia sp. ASG 101 TaxID=2896848 RepID=UPI001E4E8560|nr:FtsX-like permease family protein [Yinghuangia sp. ASG 101]UGQ14654.1 FtsX-like permease family protein [Yinghuangia sp. ASG 101]